MLLSLYDKKDSIGLFHQFTDTVFLKESSDLQNQYDTLSKLIELYPILQYRDDYMKGIKTTVDLTVALASMITLLAFYYQFPYIYRICYEELY